MNSETIFRIIERHDKEERGLVSILLDIQNTFGYLPKEALRILAYSTGRSLPDIYSLVTFHDSFRLRPAEEDKDSRNDARGALQSRKIRCSHCNHSLMCQEHPVDGHPSINITASFGVECGWLRFSSIPCSYSVECEYELSREGVVNFFCPHCHAEFLPAGNCGKCGAPMVPMIDRHGLTMQVCSNLKCTKHMRELVHVVG
ncbi:MAG: NAD(P)H-dependent oxidoreductase subunit E [Candidatus Eisenbacteria bacterium]|nr:NAD(P)H-dependent oxidoreductase subunit E [Candidatus Eisenbacteria bacterium]